MRQSAPSARPAARPAVVAAVTSLPGTAPDNTPDQSPLGWSVAGLARRESIRRASVTAGLGMSPNLLLNPGAEVGDPSLSGFSAVTIPGWTVSGTPTVIQYGTPRNAWPIGVSFPMPDLPSFMSFPKASSGPSDGGAQFFGGGNVATSTLSQIVDLSGAAAQIDSGTADYTLSGWLGGYLLDLSAASVKVDFLDSDRTYLGTTMIGPVGVLERGFQTGLRERSTSGTLPEGTRYAQVMLTLRECNPVMIGFNADYNASFADNLSFTISADLPAPTVSPAVSTVGELDHFFMVMMENKGYDDIVGSPNAPFLNSLINAYGFADNYYGLTHPSLPNYYPLVGGTDFGLTYNCETPCIDADTTLVSNIDAAGKTWRGYAQSMPYPGALEPSGDYSPEQLPFLAFTGIGDDPVYAAEHVFPLEQMAIDLSSAQTAPDYLWFSPNEDFNGEGPVDFPWGMLKFVISQITPGHQYNVPALDQFLAETVPIVLNSTVWRDPSIRSVLVVTFDEDNNNTSLGFGNEGNHIVTVVIPSTGAVAAGMRGGHFLATDQYNHYSLLRMIEDSLGLPTLTDNDRYAPPMNEFWTDGTGRSHTATLM